MAWIDPKGNVVDDGLRCFPDKGIEMKNIEFEQRLYHVDDDTYETIRQMILKATTVPGISKLKDYPELQEYVIKAAERFFTNGPPTKIEVIEYGSDTLIKIPLPTSNFYWTLKAFECVRYLMDNCLNGWGSGELCPVHGYMVPDADALYIRVG